MRDVIDITGTPTLVGSFDYRPYGVVARSWVREIMIKDEGVTLKGDSAALASLVAVNGQIERLNQVP